MKTLREMKRETRSNREVLFAPRLLTHNTLTSEKSKFSPFSYWIYVSRETIQKMQINAGNTQDIKVILVREE